MAAGAWEQQHYGSVLVAILHTEVTTIAWSFGLRNLIVPSGSFLPLAGMPFDHARNSACKALLDSRIEWVYFLDSDVIPPHDAILRLMDSAKRTGLPLISGFYCRRSPPCSVPVMIRNGQWVTDFVRGSLVEVDLVGSGCWLLHRSFLEHMAKFPSRAHAGKIWFDWRVDCQGLAGFQPGECLSEDFVLCQNARRQGIKIIVDTSVKCRHVGFGEATDGKFEPLVTSPYT